jgi:thioredoxin reductase/NAD-dependent dihydropyrimidine dehydrogenase PreA subunit
VSEPPTSDGESSQASSSSRHRTLFGIRLSDPRERRQVAGGRKRGSAIRARSTSDVRRFRAVMVGALAAAVAVLVAWFAVPAPSSRVGALALPHSTAKLACDACHVSNDKPAVAACNDCHGPHESRRAGHRALAAQGKLKCSSCHDVHGDDQGVRFTANNGEVIRYGVGRRNALSVVGPAAAVDLTVPLIPLARCGGCHDLGSARDPIQRCAQGTETRQALNVCFDEHQSWSAVAARRPGKVCAEQHGNARFAAWDAAREVIAAAPSADGLGDRAAPIWWLGSSVLAGVLGMLGFVVVSTQLRRRRKRREPALVVARADRARLPVIDGNSCLGCYACVDACPYDVLQVERYVAFVARPEACCGLSLCEQVCPNGSLTVSDGEAIDDRPRVNDLMESLDTPGVYLAGDVTGVPLIKNAIAQGHKVLGHIADELTEEHPAPLDVLIVGAGPAGISAALAAQERGLRYRVIEQGSVAQSIRSFPRGKLVFDQPLELPVAGKLWLEESTKEELLRKWMRIVRKENLLIDEGTRFSELTYDDDGFKIETLRDDEEQRYHAARVLLCIGMRGSPRKLNVAVTEEVEDKVFYHLADARSFEGQRVLVVGLGDVAMESAIALARQPTTEVTVSYRGDSFSRGKSRNIAELERLIAAGRLQLIRQSQVGAIERGEVMLQTPDGERRVANDAVFVMIGSVPPVTLLEKAGVRFGGSE